MSDTTPSLAVEWIEDGRGNLHVTNTSAIKALQAENAELRKATQLCTKHQPTGGTRGRCLVCAVEELSAAMSRISYAVGEPNEMLVADYDITYDAEAVARGVEKLRSELEAVRAEEARYTAEFNSLLASIDAGRKDGP